MVAVVEEFVPKRVHLVNVVVVLQWEVIGTFVPLRPLLTVARLTVQRLHEVPNVVDYETEGVGLGHVLVIVELVHQVGIDQAALVVRHVFAGEPGDEVSEGVGQVSWIGGHIVVTFFAF